MVIPIPNKIRRLWNIWDLRVLITVSLFLQAILILLASARKRTGSRLVSLVIWVAYLLADWVAAVAVGHASSSQLLIQPTTAAATEHTGDLLAFWAPFLLLHLGGPDSITSFSLEDNELWLRHLFSLVLQFLAVVYVFLQTLPENKLWVPTILMLVVGTIKYAERTRALCIASLDRFGVSVLPRPDPGCEYEKISRRISFIKKSNLPKSWVTVDNPERKYWDFISESGQLDDRLLLEAGYTIFSLFKGLIVGQIFSSDQRETSKSFFSVRTATEAFKLVEFELSFIYDVLHTKLAVVRSRLGYTLRLICFSSEVASFLIFVSMDKKGFNKFDQSLTFSLLISAMILETVSFIMVIFSDWMAISLKKNRFGRHIASLVLKKQRWSKSVSQCNLIDYCLARRTEGWLEKFAKYLGLDDFVNKMVIMMASIPRSQPVNDNLKELIFKELKAKSGEAPNVEIAEILCSRGRAKALLKDHHQLEWTMDQFQYSESLLLWHIATDLCYSEGQDGSDDDDKKLCKLLSDYMFYLPVIKPKMMAPVAGNWQLVFQDTCAEAKRFFHKSSSSFRGKSGACEQVLRVETEYRSAEVKGDKSKSVLFDACNLAKHLLKLEKSERWRLTSRVWVEFMSYAAINCRPTVHAEQPSTGGELLTFIWLLSTHLGLGKQFYQQVSVETVKLLAPK